MVVVMSLGSSAEPIGGGSTYLRVVMSATARVSAKTRACVVFVGLTLFRVDLLSDIEVDA